MPKTLQFNELSTQTGRSLAVPSLFAAFPDELRMPLMARARLRKFSAGQIIQHSGDTASGFWIIRRGQVKIGRYGEGGRFQMLALMSAGDSYGELSVFSGKGRVVDAVALAEAELYWVDKRELDDAIAEDAQMARELIRILSAQLQETLNMLIAQRRLSAPKLLSRSLLALARGAAKDQAIKVSQDDLAELIGVSRMTISSALSKMEAQRLIKRGYRRIEILDHDALADY